MPTVANTPIKICSRASLLIGGDAIQSFSDGTAEASVCDAMYEDMARSALTNCRWRFATDQATLVRLTNVPTGRWDERVLLVHRWDVLGVHGPLDCLHGSLRRWNLVGGRVFGVQYVCWFPARSWHMLCTA